MNMSNGTCWLLFIIFFSAQTIASDLTVYGQRLSLERQFHNFSTTHISAQTMERYAHQDPLAALSLAPGIHIQKTSSLTAQSFLSLRGHRSSDLLVLIDGMEMNDPMAPGGINDGHQIMRGNIKSIEIIRGPQGALFGPRGSGGVISIETYSGKEVQQLESVLNLVTGSHQLYQGSITQRHNQQNSLFHAFHIEGAKNKGYNLTTETMRSRPTKEGGQQKHAHGHIGITSESSTLMATIHLNHAHSELDRGYGEERDSAVTYVDNTSAHGRLFYQSRHLKKYGLDLFNLSFHQGQSKRNFVDLADDINPSNQFFLYRSDITNFFTSAKAELGPQLSIAGGYEWLRYSGTNEQQDFSRQTQSVFLSGAYYQDLFFLNASARADQHDSHQDDSLIQLSPGFYIPSLKLDFNLQYSQGSKAPTLFELYSEFGNQDLKSEKTRSYEINLSRHFQSRRLTTQLSFFKTQTQDVIDFIDNQYLNNSRLESLGADLWLKYRRDLFEYIFSYSYLQSWSLDEDKKQSSLNRARHRATFASFFQFHSHLGATAKAHYQGKRTSGTMDGPINLPSHLIFDFGLQFRAREGFLEFKIKNALDKKYSDVAYYHAPPRSFFLGGNRRF